MARVRIISDGERHRIVNDATGEDIPRVRGAVIHMDVAPPARATLYVDADMSLVAEAALVETVPPGRFPYATDAEPAAIRFDVPVPAFGLPPGRDLRTFEAEVHGFYSEHARRFADVLRDHAPQAFVDHLLAELCARRASLLKIKGE